MYKIIYLVALGIVCTISLSFGFGIKRYSSHLMLEYNWPEPNEGVKKIPHESYCHFYYQRHKGEHFSVRKCPAGEMFDYHIHECKEKHSAQCWSHHYGKHAVHDHIHSKWRKHFKCPFPEGNYPDIFDCDKYIVCLDGKPYHKHCPPSKQFDKIRRHCVYVGVCANSTDAALVSHMCPYSSGKFAHPEDCSKYYNCHEGEPTVMTCGKSKLFHEEEGKCKNKESVDCKDRPYRETSINKQIVKSVAADKLRPRIPSVSIDSNVDRVEAVVLISQTGTTKTPDKTSVIQSKATIESILQSGRNENVYSSTSANTDQPVALSDATGSSFVSASSKNIAESTAQSITENSHSSMLSSNIVESTVKPKATDDSPTSNTAESTVKTKAADYSFASNTAESTVKPNATNSSHSTHSSTNLIASTKAATMTHH